MALISKIRRNSWILVVLIGLALAGFIIMDMTSAGGSSASSGQFTLGTVEGRTIDYREFQTAEQVLYQGGSGNTYAQRNYLWNYFVEKAIVDQESEQLGLGVSRSELIELQFGNNLSPIITQRFSDRNTGRVNREYLNNMKSRIETGQLNPDERSYWMVQEKEIIKDRKQKKISDMVSKGIYTPTWMAEMRSVDQSTTVSFEYVKIPYTDIEDASVQATDEDYNAYVKENAALFTQDEETRMVEFVEFDVFPTADDSTELRTKLEDLKEDFAEAESDSVFVLNRDGYFDVVYHKADKLNETIGDSLFEVPISNILGPFIEDGQYRLLKVLDRKIIPDSVRSRHILRQVTTQQELNIAILLLDSLEKEIDAGNLTFEKAAEVYGTDGTRTKGGDLGYIQEGGMVPQFNDLIFYQAEEGKLYRAFTQFGLHLVEVTGKKFITNTEGVKFAYIYEDIIPSKETQDTEYDLVLDFLSKNNTLESMRASAAELGKEVKTSIPLQQNDYNIPGLNPGPVSRDIVRYIFTPGIKVGDVSPDVHIFKNDDPYFNNKYVIAGLSSTQSDELPSGIFLKDRIEADVIKAKKAEQIIAQIGTSDLATAASTFNVEIGELSDISTGSNFISDLGNEPKVVGALIDAPLGQEVGPIEGRDAIYLLKINSRQDGVPSADISSAKNLSASLIRNQIGFRLWDAIRNEVKVEDNRFTYY